MRAGQLLVIILAFLVILGGGFSHSSGSIPGFRGFGCFGLLYGAQDSAVEEGVDSEESLQERQRQLRIYRNALFEGASEEIRVDAAIELLTRDDSQARSILLEAFGDDQSGSSVEAICKGFIRVHSGVEDKDDFVEPFMGVIVNGDGSTANLAAEAMIVYSFEQVGRRLERLLKDEGLGEDIRLNALYGLTLRPEKEALSAIIEAIDSDNERVATAARESLQETFGYPEGGDKEFWRGVLEDLPGKDKNEIMTSRIASQQQQLRRLQREVKLWQDKYLGLLDKDFEAADEKDKAAIIGEKLSSNQSEVKLWALDKVSQQAVVNKLGEDVLASKLIMLVADEDRDVRLATAKVLAQMSELDPGEALLDQLNRESYSDVRLELFWALGEATYYAFSPGSKMDPSERIRNETMRWAKEFVGSEDPAAAEKGAEVIRKLLEINGFEASESEGYLRLVYERYQEQRERNGGELAGQLLDVMSKLCGQGSGRETAARMFREEFVAGLEADNDTVRRAAVRGLINIDRPEALKIFVAKDMLKDSSSAVVSAVLETAAMVGGESHLEWLAGRVEGNSQSEGVWDAMVSVLSRQRVDVVMRWADVMAERGELVRAAELLEMAENKAQGRDNGMIAEVTYKLASLYDEQGRCEKSIKYILKSEGEERDSDRRRQLHRMLLENYLSCGKFDRAGELVIELLGSHLVNDDELSSWLAGYFDDGGVSAESKVAMAEVLRVLEIPADNAVLIELIEEWGSEYAAVGSEGEVGVDSGAVDDGAGGG
jgi:HEAT repeat protein